MKIHRKKYDLSACSEGQKNYLRKQRNKKRTVIWSRLLIFIMFLLLWQMAAELEWIDKFYFSSPKDIAILFVKDMKDMSLLQHIGVTLLESVISFLLIIGISIILATLFWFMPTFGHTVEPFLIVLNSLPKSALAPLIIVWLGTGPRTIVLCGMSVGVFGCILNLYQVFAQTDPERLKLITTLGGTRMQAFTKVVFPGNLPTFLSIAKTNIGLALVGVIIGEFLAGRRGLGYCIIYSSQVFDLSRVLLSLIILCLIAMFLYWCLSVLERRIARRMM